MWIFVFSPFRSPRSSNFQFFVLNSPRIYTFRNLIVIEDIFRLGGETLGYGSSEVWAWLPFGPPETVLALWVK